MITIKPKTRSIAILLLTMLISIIDIKISAHDLAVKNAEGVTIYYNYTNYKNELSVTYRGDSFIKHQDRYSGDITLPDVVTYKGKTYPVTSIGSYAFYNCNSLNSIIIPKYCKLLGHAAFMYCSNLKSAIIPNTVKEIESTVFYDCYSLNSLIIPQGMKAIYRDAFYGCRFDLLVIPSSVEHLDENAFRNCHLSGVTVDTNNSLIDSRGSCNAIIDTKTNILVAGSNKTIIPEGVKSIFKNAFYGRDCLVDITIPKSVSSIGDNAFEGCRQLTSVIILDSVSSIGNECFKDCDLKDVICKALKIPSVGNQAFDYETITLHVPTSMINDYTSTTPWNNFKKIVPINEEYYHQLEITNKLDIVQHDSIKNKTLSTLETASTGLFTQIDANVTESSAVNLQTTAKTNLSKRIALVIGNANYASQRLNPLNSPLKDARDIREKLEKLGFNVRPVVENGSKNTMRKAIKDFIKEAKNYDVALFYYSGHGIQSKPGINATNYLIPSDAKLQYSESLSGECIDLNEMVLNNLSKEREGKASLVFIDACRTVLNLPSESDFGDTKGGDKELRGLNEQASPEGVCVVYATRAGSVSYDIRQKTEDISQNSSNSYFTQGLLECLDEDKDKNLPMFIQRLKDKVRAKTNGRQVPSPYNELYGDFYFDPNK